MRHFLIAAAVLAAASPPASAQSKQPAAAPDYSKDSAWLCLPGRADVCSTPLATTALNPNGYGSTGKSAVAKDPPIDCFYVYPTVSRDPGMNSDLNPSEEKVAAEAQFTRFASVCRPFAPIYRQMTVSAVVAFTTGADITKPSMIAFQDIATAWKTYLERYNKGRPFVLIGHSQGSFMLQLLIANVIEKDPAIAERMKLAILPGFDLLIPEGKLVGGTFKSTPLCSRDGETGCVLTWTSFREKNVPPAGAIFGISDKPGMTVGCVNPGKPGAHEWVPLDSYWYSRSSYPVPGGPIAWSTQGAPPTPYLRTEGLVSGKCINDGARGYLWIRTNADPKDNRTDRIGGEVAIMGMFLPGWGMHLADMSEAQGDLIRQVGAIAVAEASSQSRTTVRR